MSFHQSELPRDGGNAKQKQCQEWHPNRLERLPEERLEAGTVANGL